MFTFQLCSLNCIKCMAWGDSIPTAQDWSWPCTCTVPIVTQQPQHTDLSESRWCRRSLCSRGAQEASRAAALPEPSSDGLDCSWRWSPERDREWSRGPPPLNTPTDTRWQEKSSSVSFISCLNVWMFLSIRRLQTALTLKAWITAESRENQSVRPLILTVPMKNSSCFTSYEWDIWF